MFNGFCTVPFACGNAVGSSLGMLLPCEKFRKFLKICERGLNRLPLSPIFRPLSLKPSPFLHFSHTTTLKHYPHHNFSHTTLIKPYPHHNFSHPQLSNPPYTCTSATCTTLKHAPTLAHNLTNSRNTPCLVAHSLAQLSKPAPHKQHREL